MLRNGQVAFVQIKVLQNNFILICIETLGEDVQLGLELRLGPKREIRN
jgi:hypothetical protein